MPGSPDLASATHGMHAYRLLWHKSAAPDTALGIGAVAPSRPCPSQVRQDKKAGCLAGRASLPRMHAATKPELRECGVPTSHRSPRRRARSRARASAARTHPALACRSIAAAALPQRHTPCARTASTIPAAAWRCADHRLLMSYAHAPPSPRTSSPARSEPQHIRRYLGFRIDRAAAVRGITLPAVCTSCTQQHFELDSNLAATES